MTYCLAVRLDHALVFASDTRTNAGVDYITYYSKMHVFAPAPGRLFVILSAGNLATTQQILDWLRRDLEQGTEENLNSVRYLFEAAQYVGRVNRRVQETHADALSRSGVNGEATLILGGQVGEEPHGLYMIYPQGNYIATSAATPFLQIGESKYGKPVLDRLLRSDLSMEDAARLALVSLEATARSNITVGPPFEIGLYRSGDYDLTRRVRYDFDSPYYAGLQNAWQEGLTTVFRGLPKFEWEE